ncbi:hypothetical protein DQ04_19591010 [Trypanosoma grayi]|uniref:hypothetical protein n=1 Tax=Trypanosoma grayi TaxID=71804 RepID=UPI0004F4BAF0|nr:hypothetical protein DQ04_19591010 [Trypanosoma grayi]KEG05658.1 hypothetical protein DQ04_19591010 [Trypanosoma grayi]
MAVPSTLSPRRPGPKRGAASTTRQPHRHHKGGVRQRRVPRRCFGAPPTSRDSERCAQPHTSLPDEKRSEMPLPHKLQKLQQRGTDVARGSPHPPKHGPPSQRRKTTYPRE